MEHNPVFPQPNDVKIKIWRYIDFSKIVDLLEKKTLFYLAVRCGSAFEGLLI
ncbi:MAG: hypothetical protein HY036_02340 [Nitrospirae bacterium]|nr:hypothetical protein [Nitrospirota bacterium]MBI3351396.1 hypothetical protein [Nitrospirota bacterium]